MPDSAQTALEKRIRYTFRDKGLLENALMHSSYVNEQPVADIADNERLEFLGDAVLSLIISHLLMERFPELKEGELSKIRSGLVNEASLADVARTIDLGGCLRLGRGETQSEGYNKSSILSDAFEALTAAVYLDGGFDAAAEMIRLLFSNLLDTAALETNQDHKSRLQEFVQANLKSSPEYRMMRESGPDHDKTFEVELRVGEIRTTGCGKSKKTAEQKAARKALEVLEPRG